MLDGPSNKAAYQFSLACVLRLVGSFSHSSQWRGTLNTVPAGECLNEHWCRPCGHPKASLACNHLGQASSCLKRSGRLAGCCPPRHHGGWILEALLGSRCLRTAWGTIREAGPGLLFGRPQCGSSLVLRVSTIHQSARCIRQPASCLALPHRTYGPAQY